MATQADNVAVLIILITRIGLLDMLYYEELNPNKETTGNYSGSYTCASKDKQPDANILGCPSVEG